MSRIDRLYRDYTVTATDEDGFPTTLTGVDVALLAPRATPTGATTWTPAASSDGRWRVLLAGPDADPSAAVVVPAAGADVWLRVTDNPEVEATRVERITVT